MKHRGRADRRQLTLGQVSKLLCFDLTTGHFFHLVSRGGIRSGVQAGTIHPVYGYRMIGVGGIPCKAHHLAWLFTYGVWPEKEIDHINRDADDNRPENLREATPSQNLSNRPARSDNKCGVKGVCWVASKKKWKAEVCFKGERRHIGYFDALDEASNAYDRVAYEMQGKFACVNGSNETSLLLNSESVGTTAK